MQIEMTELPWKNIEKEITSFTEEMHLLYDPREPTVCLFSW